MSDLRSRRRRRRLGDLEWGDLAYRVYTTSLGTLVIAVLLSSWVGDNRVTGPTAQQVLTDGPAYAGLALAAMFLIGVRSGSRGGPIAMEPADVQHLMLAPVDRGALLRRPLAGVVGYGVLGGLVVGGLAGSLFHQRLPGSVAGWILSGALFGATAVGITLGSALVTCSRILPRWLPLTIAWIIFFWAIADAAGEGPISPTTYVGKMLFWPLEFSAIALVAVVLAIVLPIVGARVIGGLSVEQARRRTALVGQLRFAVTQQDLRSVVLLRRNLASERPRNRPWVRWLPSLVARHFPTVGRDLRSVARWPIVRIVRVLVLGVTAGLALRGLWSGTTPLVLVAGLAIYVAGLDCTEPLAQEVDHPQITEGFPTPIGQTLSRHLVQPVIVMLGIGIVGLAAAYLVNPDTRVLEVGWIVVRDRSPRGGGRRGGEHGVGSVRRRLQLDDDAARGRRPRDGDQDRLAATGRDHRLPARVVRASCRPRRQGSGLDGDHRCDPRVGPGVDHLRMGALPRGPPRLDGGSDGSEQMSGTANPTPSRRCSS